MEPGRCLDNYHLTGKMLHLTSFATLVSVLAVGIAANDPYFNTTVLLLKGDVTPFTSDASTNTFDISPVGATSANTNNPLQPGYYSGSFNGTGDYLSVPTNAVFDFGSGDFTVEAWIYLTTLTPAGGGSSNAITIITALPSSGTITGWGLDINNTNYVYWDNWVSSTEQYISATNNPITINTWYHVAVSRQSSTFRIFVNGNLCTTTGTVSQVTNTGSNIIQVGAGHYTGYPNGLTGQISNLRVVKGTAVYTGVFTPPTLAPLTNAGATSAAAYPSTTNVNITFASSATSLLTLQTNQAQNNNQFRDSSTNNFAVTRTGTPTQGTFTPFSQTGWSGYFNGTTDYLSNSSMGALGSGSFTIELWVYTPSVATNQCFIGNAASPGYNNWQIDYISGTTLRFLGWYDVTFRVAVTLPINSWNHIAVSRNGTNCAMFLNGTRIATPANDSHNYSVTLLNIGREADATMYYTGYLSNVRIVTGTYVYDPTSTTITVPTAPLALISGTSLLTLQSNYFKDNSSNNFAITATGTPSVQAFSPFAPTAAYSAATVGGSMYFNGSTDYLSVPDNVAFTMGAGDFTLEAWVYLTNAAQQVFIGTFDAAGSASSPSFTLGLSSTGLPRVGVGYAGAIYYATATAAITTNTWVHIAGVRNGANVYVYTNGVQSTALNMAALAITDSTQIVAIGRNGAYNGEYVTGYISNVRIVKGLAVYTAAFTPPTAPLTAIAGTSLLLNATNSGIYDSTGKNTLTTVGDARISTAVTKYGTGAMYFDGTGDYLSIPDRSYLQFGTGNFTIELWYFPTSSISSQFFCAKGSGADGFEFRTRSSAGGNYYSFWLPTGASAIAQASVSVTLNVWQHLAVVRSGSTVTLYINGIVVGSGNDSTNFIAAGSPIIIGADGARTLYSTGYIDDLRITKYARYTANFAPPSAALLVR